MSFSGSTAIVTGGASGIGLAISERLARDGAKVSVFDLDLEQAEHAAQSIRDEGGEAIACEVDVSNRAQVEEGVERTRARPWSGARAGQQCREGWIRSVHRHQHGALGTDHRGEPHRHVPLHAGGAARHARGEVGPHREHLVVERADGSSEHVALRVVEGRHDRHDEVVGARARTARHHRQHDPARVPSTRR